MFSFCTYFDSKYLCQGLALYKSLEANCESFQLDVLCLDESCFEQLTERKLANCRLWKLADLEEADPELLAVKPSRSKVEYYFTSTPSLSAWLLSKVPENELLTYLDADLFFFDSPTPIFKELCEASIGIVEHRFPPELDHLVEHGRFNVGWVSFRNDTEGRSCVDWWRKRCIEWCSVNHEEGRYADQTYLDEWPKRFSSTKIVRNIGANVAPWNVGGYSISAGEDSGVLIDGVPLIFYHFHNLRRVERNTFDSGLAKYGVQLEGELRSSVYQVYVGKLVGQGETGTLVPSRPAEQFLFDQLVESERDREARLRSIHTLRREVAEFAEKSAALEGTLEFERARFVEAERLAGEIERYKGLLARICAAMAARERDCEIARVRLESAKGSLAWTLSESVWALVHAATRILGGGDLASKSMQRLPRVSPFFIGIRDDSLIVGIDAARQAEVELYEQELKRVRNSFAYRWCDRSHRALLRLKCRIAGKPDPSFSDPTRDPSASDSTFVEAAGEYRSASTTSPLSEQQFKLMRHKINCLSDTIALLQAENRKYVPLAKSPYWKLYFRLVPHVDRFREWKASLSFRQGGKGRVKHGGRSEELELPASLAGKFATPLDREKLRVLSRLGRKWRKVLLLGGATVNWQASYVLREVCDEVVLLGCGDEDERRLGFLRTFVGDLDDLLLRDVGTLERFGAVFLDRGVGEEALGLLKTRLWPGQMVVVADAGEIPTLLLREWSEPDHVVGGMAIYYTPRSAWLHPHWENPPSHEGPTPAWSSPEARTPSMTPAGRPWPKISVITVTLNQGHFIERTIKSVLEQGYPNLEYIVLDGGSKDGTPEILAKYGDRLAYWHSRPDKGQSSAINEGFDRAGGEILTWLNSDDWYEPDALFRVAATFDAFDTDLVIGGCALVRNDEDRPFQVHRSKLPYGKVCPLPLDRLLDLDGCWQMGDFFYQPEVFFTRDIWDSAGGRVDEELFYSMDYDLWLRYAMGGARFIQIPEVTTSYRMHDAQKTTSKDMPFVPELREVNASYRKKLGKGAPLG